MRPDYNDRGRDSVGLAVDFLEAELERKRTVNAIIKDLSDGVKDRGNTNGQANIWIDELFLTFATEWLMFILVGNDLIATAIQNDVTLTWLDNKVRGTSHRDRILNKLAL